MTLSAVTEFPVEPVHELWYPERAGNGPAEIAESFPEERELIGESSPQRLRVIRHPVARGDFAQDLVVRAALHVESLP